MRSRFCVRVRVGGWVVGWVGEALWVPYIGRLPPEGVLKHEGKIYWQFLRIRVPKAQKLLEFLSPKPQYPD